MFKDSVDKIVFSYFAAVTKHDFIYKGHEIKAKPLSVNNLLLRSFSCLPNCAGCCPVFSLDYLPDEAADLPSKLKKQVVRRVVELNGKKRIYSELQENTKSTHCRFVDDKGLCLIHGYHPFSCDFELIRSIIYKERTTNRLTTKLFGRGWNFIRIDGERGALCTIGHITPESIKDTKRKLKRLQEWCEYFNIDSWCPDIINWIDKGNLIQEIIFKVEK